MKKYLFIYGILDEGGAQHVMLDIFNNFDYEHNEVTLLQITGGGHRRGEVNSDVRVIEAWPDYCKSFSFAYHCSNDLHFDWFLRHRFLKTLNGEHFDVAISFLEGMPLKVHAMITEVADRNYSWVHVDLDNFPYEVSQFRKGEEISAYNKMDGVVCVAADTAKAFQRRFPACTTSVQVIYNPIDIAKIEELSDKFQVSKVSGFSEVSSFGAREQSSEAGFNEVSSFREGAEFKIAVCGRLSEQKKLDRVIRLARRIKDEGLKIKIQLIGDGDLREELSKLSELSGVEDVVEFLGFQRNPFPYVKAADMLLSTSGYEGFSLVICEAMALGVPVVATKTAGPMEILDNDRYGLLCEHDDESIYQAVKRMYEDAELRRHYSEVGKERVKEFSVERTMKEIYEL